MRLILIAAVADNNAIGYQNKLLYWLPEDLKRFKRLTTGHTILMGRKTFESFPKGALPNRRNVVLTHQEDLSFPGAECFPSLQAALASCKSDEDVFVIGGESLYKATLPMADKLCLTEIEDTPEKADAFFPSFRKEEWSVTFEECHPKDEKHSQVFTFKDYERK